MKEKGIDYLNGPIKRDFDRLGAGLLAVILWPGAAVGAGLSAIDTRSPIYSQQRPGEGGKYFKIYKFRSLPKDANNDDDKLKTFGTFDPRASKIGRFLRRTGIDELPQLWNILKGDMSIVNLRATPDEALEKQRDADPALAKDWEEAYAEIGRPGWVSSGSLYKKGFVNEAEATVYGMKLDLEYVENATVGRDLEIIAVTPIALMGNLLRTNIQLRPIE